MQCYACDREAEQRCPRCGNVYCSDHGDNYCSTCLSPLNAAPSRGLFRFAIVGLFAGAVLALWLVVRPPSVPGQENEVLSREPTASPALTPGAGGNETGTPTPTLAPGETTAPTATAVATPTAEPTEPPTEAPTEAPAGPIEYVVEAGDTWFGIAGIYGVDAATLAAYNGLTLDDFLQIGQTILIPQ